MNTLANHLWQSTLFAAAAGLLTLCLRKNPARIRHWLWFAASCKFLIPVAVLIALGGEIEWRKAAMATPPRLLVVMDQVSQPFSELSSSSLPATPAPSGSLPAILWIAWATGFLGITCSWGNRWRHIRSTIRAGSPLQIEGVPIPVRSSRTLLEPGVFGTFRPMLLLPEGIFERLTSDQLRAVISHEMCHVRRRDNLIAAVHMFVESVFWFHPLVWWIGKRLIEERERACDEETLRLNVEPRVYAEGILNVCKLCVESPLACVAGVTGANLRQRIETIMNGCAAMPLNFATKIALSFAATAAFLAPVLIGTIHAPLLRAQERPVFEVASIKPNPSGGPGFAIRALPGGRLEAKNISLRRLVAMAYSMTDHQIFGNVPWLDSDRFDVSAKGSHNVELSELRLMAQSLLAERFNLKIHPETREVPRMVLTVLKTGVTGRGLTPSPGVCGPDPERTTDTRPLAPCGTVGMGRGRINGQRAFISQFADRLSSQLDTIVVDNTGLKGTWDMALTWTPDPASGTDPPPADTPGPSVFSAIQEQLGLKLQSGKGPVPVVVIDSVQKPTTN